MYTKYFGFNEKPFTLTPNPRFIFLSNNHKEAFAHLLYGINNHYGFIELIGEVGTGKTTVLRTLLGQLQDENYRTALIFNPCLNGVELLRSINNEFGISSSSEYSNELLSDLNRFLLKETQEGRTVVLVIDEAQNLQPDVLEQIRLISNLETENDKLIQIILVGQPELETLLERPDLRQLNQRIAVRYKLMSMSRDETRAYIRHRMEIAGETGGVTFSSIAYIMIYLYSRGVPRLVNILCDRSLVIAYGDENRRITTSIVTRGIREILHFPQAKRVTRIAVSTLLIIAVVCLAAVLWYTVNQPQSHTMPADKTITTVSPSPAVASGDTSITQATVTRTRFEQQILATDQNDTHKHAFNTLAESWGVRPVKMLERRMDVPRMFGRLAAKRNLRLTEFQGPLDQIISFDLPFVVVTVVKGSMGGYCYSILSSADSQLTISPAVAGRNTISKADLAAISSGTYYIVWKNSGQIPDSLKQGQKRFEIRTLQRLLQRAGFYDGTIDGVYSDATVNAVNAYQKSVGIPANKALGELTLATLTRFEPSTAVPSLKGK
jgi:general secretion pathway protein A